MIHNDWEMVGGWDVMEMMGFLFYELSLVHSQNIMQTQHTLMRRALPKNAMRNSVWARCAEEIICRLCIGAMEEHVAERWRGIALPQAARQIKWQMDGAALVVSCVPYCCS